MAWTLAVLMLLLTTSAVRVAEEDHLDVMTDFSSHADAARASSDLGGVSDLMQRVVGNETALSCHSFCVPCKDGRVVYLGRAKHLLKKLVDTTMVSLSLVAWPLVFVSAGYLAAERAYADHLIPVCPNLQVIQFDVDETPKEVLVDELLKNGADGRESPLKIFTKDISDMYLHQIKSEEEAARRAAERSGGKSEATGFWTKVKRATVGERYAGQLPDLLWTVLEQQEMFCGGSHGGLVKVQGEPKIVEEGSLGSIGNAMSDAFWGMFGSKKHETGFAQTCFQASKSKPL